MRWPPVAAILASGVTLGVPAETLACCFNGRALEAWPEDGVLPANGRIILSLPSAPPDEFRPYLESREGIVTLAMTDVWPRAFKGAGMVLTPQQSLKVGAFYVLRLPGPERNIDRWRNADVPFTFRIVERDEVAPRWAGSVEVRDQYVNRWVCGPMMRNVVVVPVSEEEHVTFLVELHRSDDPAEPRRTHIRARAGIIWIGQNEVDGPFELIDGVSYRATITPVDWAGNRGPTRNVTFAAQAMERR
jgi:hypothetical protein